MRNILDERRKIIVGTFILEKCRNDPSHWRQVQDEMDEVLTNPDDRALFDLPPVPAKSGD
jgi:hypothetical protein